MDFGMHTQAGNEYVARIVALAKESHDSSDPAPFLRVAMAQVGMVHPEVWDTVVRERIAGAMGATYRLVEDLQKDC